jgi:acyl-CoA reductase-like NAD-dependent aldehyde dehydrogenase
VGGSIFVERDQLTQAEADAVTERAKRAQRQWAKRPLQERIDLVVAGVAAIGAMNEEIVHELAWQMGRPIRYGGEFSGFEERALHMAQIAPSALSNIEVAHDELFHRYIKRVPHGVVLVIAPWNYPYMTAINTIAPALIAGNTVVLKHASQTPLTGERLTQAFHSVGIPDDVFQNVFLDHALTSQLVSDGRFDFVNFTGSVGGGRAIAHAAAMSFTGTGLELGGCSRRCRDLD